MIIERLKEIVTEKMQNLPVVYHQRGDIHSFTSVISERKTLFSRQKLIFTASYMLDIEAGEVTYNETLEEQRTGLGAGQDGNDTSGLTLKKWKTSSGPGGLEGLIDDQSALLKKKYTFGFDYREIRREVKQAVESNGYKYRYQIWGKLK
ncbi:hypothetical protein MASR2M79_11100 [Aminivibrio sp.]|nr:ribonucleoside-triphosphate reductase [Synergistaceae bacterium]